MLCRHSFLKTECLIEIQFCCNGFVKVFSVPKQQKESLLWLSILTENLWDELELQIRSTGHLTSVPDLPDALLSSYTFNLKSVAKALIPPSLLEQLPLFRDGFTLDVETGMQGFGEHQGHQAVMLSMCSESSEINSYNKT